MGATDIDYLDITLRTVSGCSKASEGCENCYAIRLTHRMACNPVTKGRYAGLVKDGEWTGKIITHPENLDKLVRSRPRRDGKRLRVGVDFYGDLFHPAVPDSWRDRVFATMALCPHWDSYLLTKRAEGMREYVTRRKNDIRLLAIVLDQQRYLADEIRRSFDPSLWPLPNVCLGITAENQPRLDERIGPLMALAAQGWRTWLSIEPCLGPVDVSGILQGWHGEAEHHPNCDGNQCDSRCPIQVQVQDPRPDWIVLGPETGPRRRPCDPAWLQGVVEQCRAAGVPVWCKAVPVEREKCPRCKGRGWVWQWYECPKTGESDSLKDPCSACHGTGLTLGKILKDPTDPRWPAWAVQQTAAACGKGNE